MPEAPTQLQDEWQLHERAIRYLRDRGYVLTRRWTFIAPPGHILTDEEVRALDYLIFAWDFGGLEP